MAQNGRGEVRELEGRSMNLRYLRYFIAVAEEMNFTRAAERLYTVQPSLSRQIRCLEEIVGAPLFYRDKHKLELTEAGRIFLEESRAMLRQVDRAIAMARQGAKAEAVHVAIGFNMGTESRIFTRLLPVLRQRYPEMHLSYHTLMETELIEALDKERIDVGFLCGPVAVPGLRCEVLLHQEIVAVLPTDHPLAKLRRVPIEQLAEMPVILPSATANPKYVDFVMKVGRDAGVRFKLGAPYNNVLSALHAVSLGLGFCLIADYQREILSGNTVVRKLDLDPQPAYEFTLAYRQNDHRPMLANLVDCIRETMHADEEKHQKTHAAEPATRRAGK
jgi:LysR family transcriptional regulator, hca operon transcriptional activator